MTQTKTVLKHLEQRGSISPMEALVSYGISRLAADIHRLREAGHGIYTEYKRDEAGHKYARYTYVYNENGVPVPLSRAM
jgi:hypothetical protein